MPMRRTKIVATIGPASRDIETLTKMVAAGVDVVRLNFSHGTREMHAENAELVRQAASSAGRQVAILQDLPGPKIRIGGLRDDLAELKKQPWAPVGLIDVVVKDGVVKLSGALTDERERQAIRIAAENIAGVKKVEDHLIWIEPNTGMIVEAPEG